MLYSIPIRRTTAGNQPLAGEKIVVAKAGKVIGETVTGETGWALPLDLPEEDVDFDVTATGQGPSAYTTFNPVRQPPPFPLEPLNVDDVMELIGHFLDRPSVPPFSHLEQQISIAQAAVGSDEAVEPEWPDRDYDAEREAEVAASRDTINALRVELDALKAKAAGIGADGIPESFRGLMVDGETPDKFTERMRRRWQALQHLRIDGTKPTENRALPDMTDEEGAELADLETRNAITKWLS